MPSYVHLEEALLGVHEALGQRQVVHRVGVDLRDAVLVADHLDLSVEAGDLDLTGRLGPRAADDGDAREQGQDQRQGSTVAASSAPQRIGAGQVLGRRVAAVMVVDIVPGPGVLT